MVPHDIKNIMGCLLSLAEYIIWERVWKKHLRQLIDKYANNPSLAQLTMEHLCGEGNFNKPSDQAQAIPESVLKDIKHTAEISLLNTHKDATPPLNFPNIKQEPNATFTKFVDWLKFAIERQIGNSVAQRALLKNLAVVNANDTCK